MKIEKFKWEGGFENWKTYMFHAPMDMHCFFHCILQALSEDYRKGILNGSEIEKKKIAKRLRKELAIILDTVVTKDGKKRYDFINGGYISQNQKILPKEYSLETMKKTLETNSLVNHEFYDFVSEEINKDICILDWEKKTYFKTLDEDSRIKNRKVIVLIYIDKIHYNLFAIKEKGMYKTCFESNHPFIQFLKTMM